MARTGHGTPISTVRAFYTQEPFDPGDLTTLRAPLISNAPVSTNRTALLSTTLGCAAALLVMADPFGQSDWFNPTRRFQQVQDHIDPSETWLLQDSIYGEPGQVPSYDWTNPSRGPKRPVADFIDPSEFWMLKDTMYGAPGQVPDYDWPNPVRRKHQNVAPYVSTERIIEDAVFFPFSQDDWLNSTRRFQQVQDHIDPSETWLFTQLQNPFSQNDWQNISRRYQQVQDHIDPSETWLFAQLPYPFYFSNWQNPTQRRYQQTQDHIDPSEIWLLKDSIYGAPGQVPSYDWPNPRGPKPVVADYIDPSETWLLKDTFFGPAGMGPTYDWTNPSRGRYAPVLDHIDPAETWLLKDTLFGAPGQVPSYDWPNPVRAKPAPVGYAGHIESYKINLYQIVFVPFYQTDWANPSRGAQGLKADQLGYIDPSEIWMLKDTFFGPAGMGPTYDWPNPQRVKPRSEYGSTDFYKVLLFVAPPAPFYQENWTNPTGPRSLIGDQLGYMDASEFWMLRDLVPFNRTDWNNPVLSKPASVNYAGHIETYKINLYQIVFVPFYQTDWANPSRGAQGLKADQLGYTDASEFWMLKDTFFGPAGMGPTYDWSNPQRIRPTNNLDRSTPYNINLAITTSPFLQTDWPNPLRAKSINLDRLITSYNINALAPPFVQVDWPNPKGSLRTPSHFSYYDFYKINLLNPSNAPSGRLRDWPNPSLGQPRNIGNYGWDRKAQVIPDLFGLPGAGQLLLTTFTPLITEASLHHWRHTVSLQGNMVLTNKETGTVDTGKSLLGNRIVKNDVSGEVDDEEDLLGNIDTTKKLEGE